MKTFWYHYNKPASRKVGRPQISIHYNKVCHIVDNIICGVPTKGRITVRRQPHFVMVGRCNSFEIVEGVAYVS